nr:tetratricopeptide repeat protein [Edaphobacter modestus]
MLPLSITLRVSHSIRGIRIPHCAWKPTRSRNTRDCQITRISPDPVLRSQAWRSTGDIGEGKEYLSRALQEAGLASGLDQDFYATVWSAQGWLSLLNKDTTTAISAYAHAIELWRAANGEQHMLTGWGYMLLGKSYAQAGQNDKALEQMRKGLNILDQAVGSSDPKYLAAQISYSQVLDQSGEHDEAVRVKNSAQQALKRLSRDACADCTVSAFALH